MFKTSQRKTAQRGSTFLGPRKFSATPAISVWFAIHASCTCTAKTEAKTKHRKITWHQFASPHHIVVCLLHSNMPDLQESNIAVYCSAFTKIVLKGHLACICQLPNTLHTPYKLCCCARSPMILLSRMGNCRLQKIFYGGDLPNHSMLLQTKR